MSTINGTLNSEVGSQGFYFINPAGVIFGNNASVNVPASFYVSTADSLTMSDGSTFASSLSGSSSFTAAEPKAFGFGRKMPLVGKY